MSEPSTTSDTEPRLGPEAVGSEQHGHWPGAASTPASATQPADYAALEAVYLLGIGAVVALARRRQRDGALVIPGAELPVMAVATFALADVLAKEKVSTWLREPFVQEGEDHKPVAPEGTGLRYAIGELITCARCVGTWSALGLVGLRTASPVAGDRRALLGRPHGRELSSSRGCVRAARAGASVRPHLCEAVK